MKDESERQFYFWCIKKSKKKKFSITGKKDVGEKNARNLIELKANYREKSFAAVTLTPLILPFLNNMINKNGRSIKITASWECELQMKSLSFCLGRSQINTFSWSEAKRQWKTTFLCFLFWWKYSCVRSSNLLLAGDINIYRYRLSDTLVNIEIILSGI